MGSDHGDPCPLPDAATGSAVRSLWALLLRLAGSFGAAQRDREIAAELAGHLQLHIDDNLRAGMTPGDARRAALMKLGGLAQTAESIREQHGLPFFDTLQQIGRA